MKTAVVVLSTGEYWRGAKVLFHTLRTTGNLPGFVTPIALGVDKCDFAEAVPITQDYSWIPVSQRHFPRVADKFFALTLPYDRVVMLDADMLCVGDCSYLWSEHLESSAFYACRDTASMVYYGAAIHGLKLDPNRIFNAGTMVFNLARVSMSSILDAIRNGDLQAYDGGDQGYLNAYANRMPSGWMGWLPPEYNSCFDKNMPQVPEHAKRLLHFTGGNANPWKHWGMTNDDPRMAYYARWDKLWKVCSGVA